MPTGPTFVTPSEALEAIQTYFVELTADRAQFKDWAGGVVDGGPNSDGDYPLTDFTGDIHLIPCPAKIAATVAITMGDFISKGYETLAELELVTGASGQIAVVENDGIYWYHPINLEWVKFFDFPTAVVINTDPTFAADSDTEVPSQKAVKDALATTRTGLFEVKGVIDCTTNPDYPAATKGDSYVISEPGFIGGALGVYVETQTLLVANADTVSGSHAAVGTYWFIIGAVLHRLPPITGHAGKALCISDDGVTFEWKSVTPLPPEGNSEVSTISVANVNLDPNNDKKYLRFTNTSAKTLTVEPEATTAQPANGEWHIRVVGTNNLTIIAGSGVTINAPFGGTLVMSPGMSATLKRVAENEFDLVGHTVLA